MKTHVRQNVQHLKQEALTRYSAGESSLAIAKSMDIQRYNIHRWTKEAGITRSRAVPKDVRQEILRLYQEEKMLPREIASKLCISKDTVTWRIKRAGASRSKSEGMSISVQKRRKHSKGGMWQSTKTGKWEPAASIMEMLRMQQLDADETVQSWTKTVPFIKYGDGRHYIPDILVKYFDGRRVLEEVKPSSQHSYPENIAKWQAANAYATQNGLEFKIVSEHELGGSKALREFNPGGLQKISAQEKQAREKQRYDDWRTRNKEKIAQRKKERYEQNKETVLAYLAEYNNRNREKINDRQREYNRRKRAEAAANHSIHKDLTNKGVTRQ